MMQAVDNRTGYQKLEQMGGIFVSQKMNLLEVVSGCEMPNKYYISEFDGVGGKKGVPLFKCNEKSGCLERQFCTGDMRPLNVEVLHENPGPRQGMPFLNLVKPCKCTMWCLCRPEMIVNMIEDGAMDKIGRVEYPFQCFNKVLKVFDRNDLLLFEINGNCLQYGLCCPGCPCETCQTVTFDVKNLGENIGVLEKKTKGCFKQMISDADNFTCQYPPIIQSAEHRALLVAAVLMLDYMMFEDNKKKKD